MPEVGSSRTSGWSEEQLANAATIARIGKQMGMSQRDIVIGIATAIVESGLRNVNYGDRDSLGLFQQRPSQGWGTPKQVTDPQYAARKFFDALKGVKGREQMDMGAAAQAVQRSAFPERYGQQIGAARGLFGRLEGVGSFEGDRGSQNEATLGEVPGLDDLLSQATQSDPMFSAPSVLEVNGVGEVTADEVGLGAPEFGEVQMVSAGYEPAELPELDFNTTTTGDFMPQPGSGTGGNDEVIKFAKKFLGTPYVWGGTSPQGFDCSGFVQYVYRKFGKNLPRISADQARAGKRVDLRDLQPGDLVSWDNSSRNVGADHVAIYIGDGLIIEAPRPGSNVRITQLYDQDRAWGVRL